MATSTYRKKSTSFQAEKFDSRNLPWPAGVTKEGRRYYYTPWPNDSHKAVIPDGWYLVTHADTERRVMDPEEFDALNELDV